MNRLLFLCHVREDEAGIAKTFAKALAAVDLKVTYRNIAPWPKSERPNGLLREAIETGLLECCYGVILLSEAFLAREWPVSELAEVVSRVAGRKERLIHVRHRVSLEEVSRAYPPLGRTRSISLDVGCDAAALEIHDLCADELEEKNRRRIISQINLRSLPLLMCRECKSPDELKLECLTAPPLGTSGVLMCRNCGRGYPIRNGIPQLLSEGAFNPDEPAPPSLEPAVDIESLKLPY